MTFMEQIRRNREEEERLRKRAERVEARVKVYFALLIVAACTLAHSCSAPAPRHINVMPLKSEAKYRALVALKGE